MTFDIKFNDAGRESKSKANPGYPDGADIDMRTSATAPFCCTNLPYPAPRVGNYSVRCRTCNWTGIITVAGRADDPRTLTVNCKAKPQ